MELNIGPLTAESSEAESAKFTAPLVLLHGLWDQPRSWRPFTSFLSHRGWRCISVGWPPVLRESVGSVTDSLRSALAEIDDPPVLIGHDFGGLLALRISAEVRAAVALAPSVPPPLGGGPASVLERSGTWLERVRGANRRPGSRLTDSFPVTGQTESPDLLRELAELSAEPPPAADAPRLVVAAENDPITPPQEARALADAYRADFEVVAGDHALHVRAGWEQRAGTVHRWLVKSLGEDLLALYEEAWADREES